jgi:hypothetical protein
MFLMLNKGTVSSLRTCYIGPHLIYEEEKKKKKNITAILCKTNWNFYKIHGVLTK